MEIPQIVLPSPGFLLIVGLGFVLEFILFDFECYEQVVHHASLAVVVPGMIYIIS